MWYYLLLGFVLGFFAYALLFSKVSASNRFNSKIAFKISEQLFEALKTENPSTILETFNNLKQEDFPCVIHKQKKNPPPQEQNIWYALIFYLAHKYALYQYNERNFHTVMQICYGTESKEYKQFYAIDTIINYSPAYYSNHGIPRSNKSNHNGFFDYADHNYYEYIYQLCTNGKI